MDRIGWARFGGVWRGNARQGSVRQGLAGFGKVSKFFEEIPKWQELLNDLR
jgi:hypothetical protein